ncbi:MAG: hypothetical protein WAT79_00145 [Saprospiraceae bacterium]
MEGGEKFLLLENDIKPYKKILSQASDVVMDENVSKYPIFVFHQQEVEIGIALIETNSSSFKWNVNVSTLEEFVSKGIVFEGKIDEFRQNYKDPDVFLCIFSLSELGAQFLYVPRH